MVKKCMKKKIIIIMNRERKGWESGRLNDGDDNNSDDHDDIKTKIIY